MFQELLNRWGIRCDEKIILSMWNESHRAYHSLNHLNDMIDQINENKLQYSQREYEKLIIATLFHDIVYDPMRSDNEEKSAQFFMNCCEDKSNPDVLEINQIILDTITHESNTPLSEVFCHFDMNIVERDFNQLLKWEKGIFEEFQAYGPDIYKQGRLTFLESLMDKYPQNTDNLLKLIDYVKKTY